jgi:NarL family two-component system response regulator LiaR
MDEAQPIRVVIVDDHDMIRSGLAVFLDAFDDLKLVGEAADGSEAIRLCDEVKPDVTLMDLMMPQMDGIAAIRTIRQAHPNNQVIVLTSFSDQNLVQEALHAGAIGYLLKNTSVDQLAEAIRAARAGRPALAREALQALVETPSLASSSAPENSLTERECEVLALMVEGLNNAEIAQRLSVSRSTVKTHISNILAKLGVSNRIEAAALAMKNHLVN